MQGFRLRHLIVPLDRGLSRRVIRLAAPVILSNLSRVVMNLADLAMVGRLGATALAAVGMGGMLTWAVLSFAISLRTAVQTVASRRLGQRRYSECGSALHNGLLLGLLFGVPAALAGYWGAGTVVPLLLNDPEVLPLCVDYVAVGFLSIAFSSLGFVFQGFFTGVEKTRIHMNVTVAANLLNIYLNAGLIYGREAVVVFFAATPLGDLSWLGLAWSWYPFPALGVKGAALATVLASVWMAGHYLLYALIPSIRRRFRTLPFRLQGPILRRQISLALPLGFQELLVMGGFVVFFKIVGLSGTADLAATQVVFSIMSASFMPGAGVGQAGATLVGKYLGEEQFTRAETSILESLRWSLLIMGSMGLLFLWIPDRILLLFTNDPEVLRVGLAGLRILGVVQFADAVGITLWFSLSGAGNTLFPAVAEALIVWCFFLPVSYLSGVVLGYGFLGSWVSLGLYLLLFAAVMSWKILQGDWKHIRV